MPAHNSKQRLHHCVEFTLKGSPGIVETQVSKRKWILSLDGHKLNGWILKKKKKRCLS